MKAIGIKSQLFTDIAKFTKVLETDETRFNFLKGNILKSENQSY